MVTSATPAAALAPEPPASQTPAVPDAAPAAAEAVSPEVTREDVLRVARLSRLHIESGKVEAFTQQMRAILGYVNLLGEVDTDGVEPMAHAIALKDVLRDDVPTPMLPREAALANAPATDGQFFLVPQILGGD